MGVDGVSAPLPCSRGAAGPLSVSWSRADGIAVAVRGAPPDNRAMDGAAIDFRTRPADYRHWRLDVDGAVASLWLDVDEDGGLAPGYELKLNSYDLGVDIELHDAVQRLRFEHPEVNTVLLRSARERVFSAGANIRMLARASHAEKVNFCKFTNETRLAIEDAAGGPARPTSPWSRAVAPAAATSWPWPPAGSSWSTTAAPPCPCPSCPCSPSCRGPGASRGSWTSAGSGATGPTSSAPSRRGCAAPAPPNGGSWTRRCPRRGSRRGSGRSRRRRPRGPRAARKGEGVALAPLERDAADGGLEYGTLSVRVDRGAGVAAFAVRGPGPDRPADARAVRALGARFWPLALARDLDDAVLHLRFNEPEVGTWTFRTEGDPGDAAAMDAVLAEHAGDWFVRETVGFLERVFKRLDLSARSLVALVEPGSCFAGTLFELCLAADRSYMLDGAFEGDERPPAEVRLTPMNFGAYAMGNGRSRLGQRFPDMPGRLRELEAAAGAPLDAAAAEALGLVTFIPDDIDWEDEIRVALEERASFSADALTAMEANLRFAGPETLETKIFARLSAWQNWVFQRPNAAGADGALERYGSGRRPDFDRTRT